MMLIDNLDNLKKKIHNELDTEYCIYGKSKKVQDICKTIKQVAKSDANVLIIGESGTGKELVAKAIHLNSKRANGPFVKINCTALNDNLLESELFGHKKGAFTGAISDKLGKFEVANNGTIFLDEIGDISQLMQAKLLRVIQEKEIERVGENISRKVDVRIICATNKDLNLMVEHGQFRLDLYYRLNVITIFLPSLRERREDIPYLVQYFIEKYNKKENKHIKGVTNEVMEKLKNHDWPGNVRELEHVIEAAIVMANGEYIENVWLHNKSKRPVIINKEHFVPQSINFEYKSNEPLNVGTISLLSNKSHIVRGSVSKSYDEFTEDDNNLIEYKSKIGGSFPTSGASVLKESYSPLTYFEKVQNLNNQTNKTNDLNKEINQLIISIPSTIEDVENQLILKTLEYTNNNKTRAAKLLGISLRNLQMKVKKLKTKL